MKEKRYFCEYIFSDIAGRIIAIFIVAVLIFSIIIARILLYSECRDELNSYSETTYQYLDEIADIVIQEGVGINLQALPSDVAEYEFGGGNGVIIFKYYLDDNKDMKIIATPPNMTVVLSDNYEIISKKSNYSSEEEYINGIKLGIDLMSMSLGFGISAIFVFILLIVGIIGICISYGNKKYKDSLNKML